MLCQAQNALAYFSDKKRGFSTLAPGFIGSAAEVILHHLQGSEQPGVHFINILYQYFTAIPW
jgi:hypothetical protein